MFVCLTAHTCFDSTPCFRGHGLLLVMQGFKVVIRDIALHMSNRATDYHDEDWGLCQGALQARGQRVCLSEPDAASVQEYLEMSHFVQASDGARCQGHR